MRSHLIAQLGDLPAMFDFLLASSSPQGYAQDGAEQGLKLLQ